MSIDQFRDIEDFPVGSTVLPKRPRTDEAPTPRSIGRISTKDLLPMGGSLLSSIALSLLLFGRVATFSGRLGFVVVALVLYTVIYAVLVSLTDNRPAVVDRVK